MLGKIAVFIFFAVITLPPAVIDAQIRTESPSAMPEKASESVRKLFDSFAKHYNNGDIENQLKLLSTKTKATLVVCHLIRLGMAPQAQQDFFSEHTDKWNRKIEDFLKNSKIDADAGTYGPLTIAFSNWEHLGTYLADLQQHSALANRSNYSSSLSELKTTDDGNFASARFKIYTNGGLVAGLNGDSPRRIEAGTQIVYFARIENKWYVCNELEFKNEILPSTG